MAKADLTVTLQKFNANPPADTHSILQFEAEAKCQLPGEYAEFLQYADGGEGFIGRQISYLVASWRVARDEQ